MKPPKSLSHWLSQTNILCCLLVFFILTVCGEFFFMILFSLYECEHIYHLRGRHGAISIKKIKNNMLAAVLALTIVPLWVKVGKAVVEHGCFLISQKLLNVYTRCIPTYISWSHKARKPTERVLWQDDSEPESN